MAAFFIVQHSLSDRGFQLIKHEETQVRAEWSYVSFPALISDQVGALTDVLKNACRSLDAEDAIHHQKFMHTPLTPILNALGYPIEKLGAKRHVTDWELMPFHVDEIRKGLAELRAAMEARSEPFEEPWQWPFRKLECALGRLTDYLHDAQDLHREEIRTAIERGIHILPVLVNGATMPLQDELPEDIRGDTLRSKSEVLETRESKSRPKVGIVRVKTTGMNRHGAVVIEFTQTFMIWKRGRSFRLQAEVRPATRVRTSSIWSIVGS